MQVKHTIKVFDYTHPGCVAVFTFDWSSAHEVFANNSLNINTINIHPGGKQRKLHNMVIPHSNPDPAPDEEDTCGKVQQMTFPNTYPDPNLRG